jgi:hypothetical protein
MNGGPAADSVATTYGAQTTDQQTNRGAASPHSTTSAQTRVVQLTPDSEPVLLTTTADTPTPVSPSAEGTRNHSPATATGYRLADSTSAKVVPYPTAAGGYALVDGDWKPLPENYGRIMQSTPQSLTAKLVALQLWEDQKAGIKSAPPTESVADLTFDGRDPVPLSPGNEVVLVYVGRITPPTAKQQADYPVLKDGPAIELAPTKALRNGTRVAPLYLVAPGFMGFAANRTSAIVEQPAKDTTVLRSPAPLPAGRYALFCGARSYEVVVVD